MQNFKQHTKRNFRGTLPLIVLFVIGLLFPISIFADSTQPYLVDPIPKPHSTNVPNLFTLQVGIADDETGIDVDSISVEITPAPPEFEPIIEPFNNYKRVNYYAELGPMDPGVLVTVSIKAKDFAGNEMFEFWRFTITEMRMEEILLPVFPIDNAYLVYDVEDGMIRFKWTKGTNSEYYRMHLGLPGGYDGYWDLGPESYRTFAGMRFVELKVSRNDWNIMNETGEITWCVAPISEINGQMLGNYTETHSMRYTSDNLPKLLQPYHNSILPMETNGITFTWDNLETAIEYYFIMVRMDNNDTFTDEYFYQIVPYWFGEIFIHPSTWETIGCGTWSWTVIGVLPNSELTD
ncbi:hypothetical protein JW979_09470, partial [bacterium]|nr:hypothetical protein [candidate division CSSED10-310 bacterium]